MTARPILALWATPPRVALLRAEWPGYMPGQEIYARLQAMEGPALPSRAAISAFATPGGEAAV